MVARRRGDVPSRESIDVIDVYRYDLEVADRAALAVLVQLPGAAATVADHVAALSDREPVDVHSGQGPVTALLVGRLVDRRVPPVPTFNSPWPTEYRIRTRNERSEPRRRVNAAARWHVERRSLDGADHAITLSGFMRRELQRTYDLGLDAAVVPGGMDGERHSPEAGSSDRIGAGDSAFLTDRRLAERMGHSTSSGPSRRWSNATRRPTSTWPATVRCATGWSGSARPSNWTTT